MVGGIIDLFSTDSRPTMKSTERFNICLILKLKLQLGDYHSLEECVTRKGVIGGQSIPTSLKRKPKGMPSHGSPNHWKSPIEIKPRLTFDYV